MTTFALILIAIVLAALLVRYARQELFAGAATRADERDELGLKDSRRHLVPRHG